MSIPRDDLLFYLDGILGQISVARKLFEHEDINPVALDSVFASVMSVRSIVQADAPEHADGEDGPCPHPPGSLKRTDVGGGGWYIMCLACNELVEQSSDAA